MTLAHCTASMSSLIWLARAGSLQQASSFLAVLLRFQGLARTLGRANLYRRPDSIYCWTVNTDLTVPQRVLGAMEVPVDELLERQGTSNLGNLVDLLELTWYVHRRLHHWRKPVLSLLGARALQSRRSLSMLR